MHEAFRRRVLSACEQDFEFDVSEGYVFLPKERDERGFYTAEALRVIADELDRRNQELFDETS